MICLSLAIPFEIGGLCYQQKIGGLLLINLKSFKRSTLAMNIHENFIWYRSAI